MSDAMMELRKLVVFEASWGDATWRAAASAALGQMDEFRMLLGANEGESTVDALHRYTAAVQLGCALKLEQRAKEVAAQPAIVPVPKVREVTVAALIGGATLLRQGVTAAGNSPGIPDGSRHPCSPTCTHDDAATPGHPERVQERSEAVKKAVAPGAKCHVPTHINCPCGWDPPQACHYPTADGEPTEVAWQEAHELQKAYDRGAEAMRAACLNAVQFEMEKRGASREEWESMKAAIEGAAP